MLPKVIAIVGRSGSGKTTLITKLLPQFKSLGLKVGTIKHTHHEVDQDQPGKDSWKHRQCGSDQVLLVTGKKITVHADNTSEKGVKELSQDWFQGFDLVISEGFKQEECLKIEVSRKDTGKSPLCLDSSFHIEAVVSDYKIKTSVKAFDLSDVDSLFKWIMEQLKL